MNASPAHVPTGETSSLRGVVVPFAAVSAFLALIQVFCLGLSVVGVRIGQLVATTVVVAAAVLAGCFAAHVRSDLPPTALNVRLSSGGGRFDRVLSVLVVAVLLWAAWVWIDVLRLAWYRPPLFWDSLVYHIPAIHDWVLQGRVGFVRSVPDIPFVNYPMGVETTAFLVRQMTGTSRLVDASNLWYWPLGITALAVIAHEFGARGLWRWLAGALLVTAPTFVAQGATVYVDAGFATTVMGSLASACVFVSPTFTAHPWSAALLGLNVGLMAGAKGSGLPFALVVIAAALVVVLRVHPADRLRAAARPLLVCMGVALAVGGYWYVRNALEAGNPLYPFRLQFGHRIVRQGFDPRFLTGNTIQALDGYPEWAWRFVAWLQPDAPIKGPYSAGGLGYLWIAGALPAIVYCWLVAVRRSRPTLRALALVTALVVVLFAIQPVAWQARFTLWLLALGLPCLAAVLYDAASRWRLRLGHLLPLAIGLALGALAVWESNRTLALEWSTHRVAATPGSAPVFTPTLDLYFRGMADADGFRDFLAARTIARGRWDAWQAAGSLLGGMLAMPLGAREILVLPPLAREEIDDPFEAGTVRRPPTSDEIARAQAAGAQWFLWQAHGADEIPESLSAFERRYVYRVADEVSFLLVWIAQHGGRGNQDAARATAR